MSVGGSASSSSLGCQAQGAAQERVSSHIRSSPGLSVSGGTQLHVESTGRTSPPNMGLTCSTGQLPVASNTPVINASPAPAVRESSRHVYQSRRTLATSPSPVTMRHTTAYMGSSPQNEAIALSSSASRLPANSPACASLRAGYRDVESCGSIEAPVFASPTQVPMLRPTSIFHPPTRHTFGSSSSTSTLLTNSRGPGRSANTASLTQLEQGSIAAIREQTAVSGNCAAHTPQVLYRGLGLDERGARTTASAPCTPREGRGIAQPPRTEHSPPPDGTMSAPSQGPHSSSFLASSLTVPQPPTLRSPAVHISAPITSPRSSSLPHSNRAALHMASDSRERKSSTESLRVLRSEVGQVRAAEGHLQPSAGNHIANAATESLPTNFAGSAPVPPGAAAEAADLKEASMPQKELGATVTSDLDVILGNRVCMQLSDQSAKLQADLAQLKERVSVIWQQVELHNAYHSEILILKNQHQALRAMARTTAHKLDGLVKDTVAQAPQALVQQDLETVPVDDSIGRLTASWDLRFGELKDWVAEKLASTSNSQAIHMLEAQNKEMRQDLLAIREMLSNSDVKAEEARTAVQEAKASFDKESVELNAVREGQEVLLANILSYVQTTKSSTTAAIQELSNNIDQDSAKVREWQNEITELVTLLDTERLTLEMKQEAVQVQLSTCQQEVQELNDSMSELKQLSTCEAMQCFSKLAADIGCSLAEFLCLLSTTVRAQTVIENKLDPEVVPTTFDQHESMAGLGDVETSV